MENADSQLKDFFARELHALREDTAAFAQAHPAAASALALNKGRSSDPQVELLLQSFAYLTGRLHYQMEAGQAALPNTLMDVLYPHLSAPVPSMLVAKIDAPQAKGTLLERGRQMYATVNNEAGQPVNCRFRTSFDTELWPLLITDIKLSSVDEYPALKAAGQTRSVLKVSLHTQGNQSLQSLAPERLRFHINSEEKSAFRLYETLALNLTGLALRCGEEPVRMLEAGALRWLGFEDKQAALYANPHSHPGYRLVQEYFAFPEKFMFFDVEGLLFDQAGSDADLLFLLDLPPTRTLSPGADALQLNCTPLVNLFSQRIDPFALDHSQYEYPLRADLQNHRYCEIYAIEELIAIRPDAPPRSIAPYYAMEDFRQLGQQDYFYVARRETGQLPGIAGTELHVSFLDTHFDLTHPADEVIGGRALCTNRRLPERLRIGDELKLEGAGAVNSIHVLSKPTAHQTPQLIGARPWTLASQLSLNHLSLAEGDKALASLKEMLRLHIGPSSLQGLKQIDGLSQLKCRPVVRRIGQEGWRGFAQGLHIEVNIDRSHFDEGSAVLFTDILRRFFALYASVNTLVEVSLATHDVKGILKQWQPLIGDQPVL